MILIILILAAFFSLNMGGASFAACFAAPFGGKIVSKRKAGLLFIVFVVLGACLGGKYVTYTLGHEIIPVDWINHRVVLIVFFSAGLSMYVANLMKIPQSTSLVTVASMAGVGLYLKQLNLQTLTYLFPFWILLPLASYFLTYFLASYIYPPRRINFWIYEKLVNQQSRLRIFVVLSSCYNAFSVGTNNVANAVGPLTGIGTIHIYLALTLFAFIYGTGAFIFSGPLKTAGEQIVPLGLLTASIISLVSGTLMIIASGFGVPQSFVMLQMGAVFAIAVIKKGIVLTFSDTIAKKTLFTWTVNPFVTLWVSYGLSWLILG